MAIEEKTQIVPIEARPKVGLSHVDAVKTILWEQPVNFLRS